MQKKNNGTAIASMVLGISGILLACVLVGIIPALIGLILGIVCLVQKRDGKGMAIAGITTAAAGILIFLLAVISIADGAKFITDVSKIQEPALTESPAPGAEAPAPAITIHAQAEAPDDSEYVTVIAETAAAGSADNGAALIEEQVLLEQDGIKITALGSGNGLMGPQINLLIENNSFTNFTVQVRSMSVNGFMISPIFSSDVAAGKKNRDSISLSASDLASCGIEQMADIFLSFHIFDTESWDTILDSDIVEIKTSFSGSYGQMDNGDGETLYDGNSIKIVSQGIDSDSLFGPSLNVYIENNSDRNITVQARNTSVNGFMTEPIFSPEIAPGKKIIATMTFMSSDLEQNGITELHDIETSFHIFLTEGWDTVTDTASVTISF